MARKLRIEFPGALYHVINRGNYRRDVFETAGAAQAFVTALEEATVFQRWRVHAYVMMRNHYHLVLETPEPKHGRAPHSRVEQQQEYVMESLMVESGDQDRY